MIDIDKIQRAAEAAMACNSGDPSDWYPAGLMDGVDYLEDSDFIAACSPQTILKLIAVVRAAKAAEMGWEEGDDVFGPMHVLREALEALK